MRSIQNFEQKLFKILFTYYKDMKVSSQTILWFVLMILLICIIWSWRIYIDKCFQREPFVNVWNDKSKKLLNDTIKNADEVFLEMDIDWFASFGTLLGAVRHGDVIPWDDDADLHVNDKIDMADFKNRMFKRGYFLSKRGNQYKIYSKDALDIPKNSHKWPFVDLFLFSTTEKDVIFYYESEKTIFPKEDIFPLKRVKFGESSINIPNNSNAILKRQYGPDYMTKCISTDYNHRKEIGNDKVYEIDCSEISKPHPSLTISNLPTYVINLDRRPDRWASVQKELRKIGIKGKRFSAKDAKSKDFERFYKSLKTNKRSISELACAQSHIAVLKDFLSTDFEYALIFEDDIIFPDGITYDTINNAFQSSRGMKLLLLGHCYANDKRCSIPGSSLVGTGLCLHAYIISREGAQNMIDTYKYDEPIDRTSENLCERTGGLCYISGDVDCQRKSLELFGNGLVYQLENSISDIPIRGDF